jgi:hypothetical protein
MRFLGVARLDAFFPSGVLDGLFMKHGFGGFLRTTSAVRILMARTHQQFSFHQLQHQTHLILKLTCRGASQ